MNTFREPGPARLSMTVDAARSSGAVQADLASRPEGSSTAPMRSVRPDGAVVPTVPASPPFDPQLRKPPDLRPGRPGESERGRGAPPGPRADEPSAPADVAAALETASAVPEDDAGAEPVTVATAFKPFRLGPYDVIEEIGAGGMAVVYKAVQPSLNREVAIKVLRREYALDRQISTRFEREAAALATLQHGNVVHVYDFVREAERPYIVMEYVEGVDLFDVLSLSSRLPPDVAALIARGIAGGLEHAHHHGIVHRDIKPSNILISKKGEIKIMDFGIARDPGKSELTQVGLAVGTPAYMAPEQIRGDHIDFRTDLFALGIVLFEMMAGEKPWLEEEGKSITIKVLDEPMQPLTVVAPEVPPDLVTIVNTCLQKKAEYRYVSTHQLISALDSYIQRHLSIEPRARMLMFLRNRQWISEQEANVTLGTDVTGDATVRRRDAGIPLPPADLMFRPVVWAHAAFLLVVLAVASMVALGDAGPTQSWSTQRLTPVPAASKAGEADPVPVVSVADSHSVGFLKVVVNPWARVFVDGAFIDTTPFARPIRLAPGRHRVGLRNPYFEAQDHYVDLRPGETSVLKVALKPPPNDLP